MSGHANFNTISGDRTLRGLKAGFYSANCGKALTIALSIGNLSKDGNVKRTALTLGGIFIRSISRVLNEILGDNQPGAGPNLNAHYNTTQREYNECKRMMEAHAAQVEV